MEWLVVAPERTTMLKTFRKYIRGQAPESLVDTFIHTEQSVNELPALSPVERVQLEQDIAISHLYHSSKIEGTTLNEKRLEKAINAEGI